MNGKTWLLIVSAAAIIAGVVLLLPLLPSRLTVVNVDPPGPGFTIVILRSTPGTGYERVGTLRPGESAEAIARDAAGAWLLLDEPHGWVGAHLVEIHGDVDSLPISHEVIAVETPEPGSPVSVTNRQTQTGDFTVDVLAVPQPSGAPVGQLAPGDMASAIGRDEAGVWLLLDEPRGWVLGVVLDVTGDIDGLPIVGVTPDEPGPEADG